MAPPNPRVEGSVVVLGSINNDVVLQVARHPAPGETVSGHGLTELPGGKGANQAVAAARAGSPVKMVGVVGDDARGAELVTFLGDEGIDVSGVGRWSAGPTGTAFVLVAPDGENEIVVVPGANGTVDNHLVDQVELAGDDVVVAQHETPPGPTLRLFERARVVGAGCVLNAAPALPIAGPLLQCTTVLVVNEHELAVAVDSPVSPTSTTAELRASYADFATRGFTGALVVTLGSRGVVGVTATDVHAVAGHSLDPIDTTGAGDCFVGYLTAGLAGGDDLETALVTGNAAAALCVTRPGAAPAMPVRAEVTALLTQQTAPSTSGPGGR